MAGGDCPFNACPLDKAFPKHREATGTSRKNIVVPRNVPREGFEAAMVFPFLWIVNPIPKVDETQHRLDFPTVDARSEIARLLRPAKSPI
jgi:hypothetical protein